MNDEPRRRLGDAIYGMYQQLQEENARLLDQLDRERDEARALFARCRPFVLGDLSGFADYAAMQVEREFLLERI